MKTTSAAKTPKYHLSSPLLETITPRVATDWLNRNTGNRKLRDGVVDKYASDMLRGNWTECIVPIAFYENGDVADGQHRLWAIIESGTTQRFFVLRGLTREAGLNIDTGLGRSLVDNSRISGVNVDLTNEMLSIARTLDAGHRTREALSNATRLELYEKHKDAIKWVCAHGPTGKGLRNQCTMSAVARAWYNEADKERLARFCKVLSTGLIGNEDEAAAVAVRNMFLMNRNAHLNQLFRENFLRTQVAIKAFMKGKPVHRMRTPTEEPYPLPMAPTKVQIKRWSRKKKV